MTALPARRSPPVPLPAAVRAAPSCPSSRPSVRRAAGGRRSRCESLDSRSRCSPPPPAEGPTASRPVQPATTVAPPTIPPPSSTGVRADVDFWAARLDADPADIVAAVKLAEADVAQARLTGDVGRVPRALSRGGCRARGPARVRARR